MYICPTCNKEFTSEDMVVKHYLKCWQEKNLCHKSKPAPRSGPVTTVTINTEMADFFKKVVYDRSCS